MNIYYLTCYIELNDETHNVCAYLDSADAYDALNYIKAIEFELGQKTSITPQDYDWAESCIRKIDPNYHAARGYEYRVNQMPLGPKIPSVQ